MSECFTIKRSLIYFFIPIFKVKTSSDLSTMRLKVCLVAKRMSKVFHLEGRDKKGMCCDRLDLFKTELINSIHDNLKFQINPILKKIALTV